MESIPDKFLDLILTDLPYGTTQCKWDEVLPFEKLWGQYNRIIKDRGVIVLFGAEPFASALRMSNIKNYKYDWVWEKSKAINFLNAKRQPLRAYETLSVFYKKAPQYNPQMTQGVAYNKGVRKEQTDDDVYGEFSQVEVKSDGLRYPRNVLYFKTAESEGKTYHKTQKPLDLLEYIIRTYTNEGDLVLDSTAGAISTGLASERTGRRWINIELEAGYCELGRGRLESVVSTSL